MKGFMYLRLTLNSLCTNGDLELLILLPLLLSAVITSGYPHPWGAEDGTHGFLHAKQALYPLRHLPSPGHYFSVLACWKS